MAMEGFPLSLYSFFKVMIFPAVGLQYFLSRKIFIKKGGEKNSG